MQVKIVKCSVPTWWYSEENENLIGQTLEVVESETYQNDYCIIDNNRVRLILKSDCAVISDDKEITMEHILDKIEELNILVQQMKENLK